MLIFKDHFMHSNYVFPLISSSFKLFCRSLRFLWDKNTFELSANNTLCRMLEEFTKSLIYSMNRSGPNMDPCGTPYLMVLMVLLRLDLLLFKYSFWRNWALCLWHHNVVVCLKEFQSQQSQMLLINKGKFQCHILPITSLIFSDEIKDCPASDALFLKTKQEYLIHLINHNHQTILSNTCADHFYQKT